MGEAAQKRAAAAVQVGARPEGSFQSEAALARATAPLPAEDDAGEAQPAEVTLPEAPAHAPIVVVEDKMVKIRPLQTVASFTYGKKTYSIKAGKECLVPASVRDHLRARNLCG